MLDNMILCIYIDIGLQYKMQINQQKHLLATIPRVVQRINLQQQLPHLLIFFTEDSEQEQSHTFICQIHNQIKHHKLTHHITRCQNFKKLQKQLTSFRQLICQIGKQHDDKYTCHVVVFASVDYYLGVINTVDNEIGKIKANVEVAYVFVTVQDKSRLKNAILELEKLVQSAQAERQIVHENVVKYHKHRQKIKSQIYLSWKSQFVQAVSLLQSIFHRVIRNEYQCMSKSAQKVCVFTTNTISSSTHLQQLYSYLQERKCSSKCSNSHQKLIYLLSSLGIIWQQKTSQDRTKIKDVLKNREVRQIIKKIMASSSQLQILAYLNAVYETLWQQNQNKVAQQEADVYISVPQQHINKLHLQQGGQIVSKCLLFGQADGRVEEGSVLVCIGVQSGKYCYKLQEQQQTYLIWPLSVFQVSEVQTNFIRLTYKQNILQSPNSPHQAQNSRYKHINKLRHQNWQQIKYYLPSLKQSNALRSGSILYETNKYSYMKLTKKQNKRCNQLLLSLIHYLWSQHQYKQALRIAKMHMLFITEMDLKQYLQQATDKSMKGQAVYYCEQVQIYSQVCIKLAQIYEKEGYVHESLQVLQDYIRAFPIYYHFQATIQAVKKNLIKQATISKLSVISIRFIVRICYYLAKLDQSDLAKQFIQQIEQVKCQIHKLNKCTKQIQQLKQELQHYSNQISIILYNNIPKQISISQPSSSSPVLTCKWKLRLAQLQFRNHNTSTALQIYKECYQLCKHNQSLNRIMIDCQLGRIKCLQQLGQCQECIQGYQMLIDTVCEIVGNCVDGVDTEEAIHEDYGTLVKDIHIGYFQLLLKLDRKNEAMQLYQQYVLYYANQDQIIDFQQFITIR